MRILKIAMILAVLAGTVSELPIHAQNIATTVSESYLKAGSNELRSGFSIGISRDEEIPQVAVTKVKFSVTRKTLYLFKTYRLKVTVSPKKATDKTLTWASSNEAVATVDSDGVVTANAPGRATITATSINGKKAKCVVTVKVKKATSVKMNAKTKTLNTDTTYQLKATVYPSTATYKTVTWTSSNTSVCEVDSNGLVTAISPGTCTITAKSHNGKKATTKITVKFSKPYFSSRSGTDSENYKAYLAARQIITEKGWEYYPNDEFYLAKEIALYVAASIRGDGGTRYWTAYAGLVLKGGSCWANAHSYLFLAKELGLDVKTVAVRDGKLRAGLFEVRDYVTDARLGLIGFASDHMGIEYTYKGMTFYVEPQLGDIFIFKNNIYYLVVNPPE